MLRDGLHGVWLPAAGLEHHVEGRRCDRRRLIAFFQGVGWFEGRELAWTDERDPAALTAQLRATLRRFRMQYWFQTPWSPLPRRLAALRDLAHMEGFVAGYVEGVERKLRDPEQA